MTVGSRSDDCCYVASCLLHVCRIGVTVQSVQVRDQLEAMRSSIEQFIRQDQKNYNARIQLQLVEMEEKTVFNKTDHMQSVMKRNKEVQHLSSAEASSVFFWPIFLNDTRLSFPDACGADAGADSGAAAMGSGTCGAWMCG